MRFTKPLASLLLAPLLHGCAGLNPNNNVGLTTTDFLMQRGDCAGARQTAEPHAQNGEPWAQYRLGMMALDERCPKGADALSWLMKAATYRADTAWEKGSATAVAGPSGRFNARASASNAAMALGNIFTANGFPAMKWYWAQRAASQFGPDEPEGDKLRRMADELGKAIPEADQKRIAQHWDTAQPWHK